MNKLNPGHSYGQYAQRGPQPPGHPGGIADRAQCDPRGAATAFESALSQRAIAQAAGVVFRSIADGGSGRHDADATNTLTVARLADLPGRHAAAVESQALLCAAHGADDVA